MSLPIFLCLTLHNLLMGIVTETGFYKWNPVLNQGHTETVKVIFQLPFGFLIGEYISGIRREIE